MRLIKDVATIPFRLNTIDLDHVERTMSDTGDELELGWTYQQFQTIFLLSLAVASLKVVVKYLTKLRSTAQSGFGRSDHFDCLRLGVDLAFLGMVSVFGIFRAVSAQSQGRFATTEGLRALINMQPLFTVMEVVLLSVAVIFAAIYWDPKTHYNRGIWIPSFFGVLSIGCAIWLFTILTR